MGRIASETNCSISIGRERWDIGDPLEIVIESRGNRSNNNIHKKKGALDARDMIVKSILGYLGDYNARGRLLYELANNSTPSCGYHRSERSGVVRQMSHICNTRSEFTWMKLFNLPHMLEINGKSVLDSIFFLDQEIRGKVMRANNGNGDCSVTTFGLYGTPLTLCDPYVMIVGHTCEEVEKASAIAANVINHHSICQSSKQDDLARVAKGGALHSIVTMSTANGSDVADSLGKQDNRFSAAVTEARPNDGGLNSNTAESQGKHDTKIATHPKEDGLSTIIPDSHDRRDNKCTMTTSSAYTKDDGLKERPGIAMESGFGGKLMTEDDENKCAMTVPAWATYSRSNLFCECFFFVSHFHNFIPTRDSLCRLLGL